MSKNEIVKSTKIVALSTLLSRILGLVRDLLIASFFGATSLLDGFWVAWRIPNLFRRLVGEGCMTIAFVPVYTDYLTNKGKEQALKLAQRSLTILLLALFLLLALGEVFSPQLVHLFGGGIKNPEVLVFATKMNRIMFPYLFFVSLVAFAMGYLNSHKSFFAPAFSPVLLNLGFILGATVLSRFFELPLYGLAFGVIIGGVLQLLLQIPYMVKAGFKLKLDFNFNDPGVKRIIKLFIPSVIGAAVYQINILINTRFASTRAAGSISYLYYSDRLTEIVLGVFVVSIAGVLLPEMSKQVSEKNFIKLKKTYIAAVKSALFLAIPASVALMIVGYPVISVLFMHGNFTQFNALMTYKALLFSSMGIGVLAILRMTTPLFYSLEDSKSPLYTSIVAIVTNAVCGYFLMQTSLQHAGLALSNVIAVTVQVIMLLIILHKKVGKFEIKPLLIAIVKFIIASLVMGFVIYLVSSQFNWNNDPFYQRLLGLFAVVFSGVSVYFIVSYLLKVEELNLILGKFFKKGYKK